MSDERTRHGAQVLSWAQRLMQTKGYGWSKAIDVAAQYAGESKGKGKGKKGGQE